MPRPPHALRQAASKPRSGEISLPRFLRRALGVCGAVPLFSHPQRPSPGGAFSVKVPTRPAGGQPARNKRPGQKFVLSKLTPFDSCNRPSMCFSKCSRNTSLHSFWRMIFFGRVSGKAASRLHRTRGNCRSAFAEAGSGAQFGTRRCLGLGAGQRLRRRGRSGPNLLWQRLVLQEQLQFHCVEDFAFE